MTETDEAKPRMDAFRQNPDGLNGLDLLRRLMEIGTSPPIGDTLDFTLTEVRPGVAVFEGSPDRSVYNPLGSVHGGYAATLLDSACGCAVHSRLSATQGYTTLELKIAYHRALDETSGPVRVEGRVLSIGRRAAFAEATLTDNRGKLCASATSTLLVFEHKRTD